MSIIVKPTNDFDIAQLATHMRREDRAEIYAARGLGPLETLREINANSCDIYTGWADGHVLFGLGIEPASLVGGSAASPWFLASAYLTMPKYTREFLRRGKRAVAAWAKEYDLLVNYVDARYTTSIRWLSWLGFTIHEPEPYGYLGLPFHRIEIRRS